MKTHLLILLVCLQLPVMAAVKISVSNPNPIDIVDAAVVVKLDQYKKLGKKNRHQLAVLFQKEQVSSQLDDLDGDGIPDEMVFLTNLKAGEKKEFAIKKLSDKKRVSFPAEVYSSLILKKDDGTMEDVMEASSDKNDMYNKMHHHGVAFESAPMAYRIYFDNKSTIDVYGKKKTRLELADTKWYPSDEQLKAGYGDDILLVSGWVGVGTVKGWDGKKAIHINKFDKRTHRIIAKGNLRVIVESEVLGWEYEGKKLDMKVRYTIYARHRDALAEVTANCDINSLATGVQQIGGGACFQSDQLVGSWGSWYPQPDTVKYAKETAGLGLFMPMKYRGKQVMEGVNNLIVFPYKAGETVRFYFTTVAAKEEGQRIQSSTEFFRYLDSWRKSLQDVVVE